MALKKCNECGNEVSTKADKCPNCGAPIKKGIGCGTLIGIIVLVWLGTWAVLRNLGEYNSGNVKINQPSSSEPIKTAEQSHDSVMAEARAKIGEAQTLIKEKHYVDANDALGEAMSKMTALPDKEQQDVVDMIGVAMRLKSDILPKVKQEKAKIEKEKSEVAALTALCGPQPTRSEWDGEVPAATLYLKESAHDPDSIKVTECSEPVLTKNHCWVTTCKVRGKNAFGGTVLNIMRFEIGRHPYIESLGIILGAKTL